MTDHGAESYFQIADRYGHTLTYISNLPLGIGDLVLLPPADAPWQARVVAVGRGSWGGPCSRVIRRLAKADPVVLGVLTSKEPFNARGMQYADLRRLREGRLVPYAKGPCEITGCRFVMAFPAKYIMEAFAYDHCHLHGEVRGVLCQDCNYTMSFVDRGRTASPELQSQYAAWWARCSGCAPFAPWQPWEGAGPTGLPYQKTVELAHDATQQTSTSDRPRSCVSSQSADDASS
jgi:Recombination endonuclease VII